MERGAIDRLTEREKDCLRRWLDRRTAKEIALDLGVTPHAVEKRLKMARAKLGVTSSLEAARMLAEAEGYQQTGAQSADLAAASGRGNSWRRPATFGVIAMSLFAATLILVAQQAGVAPLDGGGVAPMPTTVGGVVTLPPPTSEPQAVYAVYGVGKLVKVAPNQLPAVLARSFRKLDLDRSGTIDVNEAPSAARVSFTLSKGTEAPPAPTKIEGAAAQAKWIAEGDRDGNGKLDEGEYADWIGPFFAAHGAPSDLVEGGE